MDPEIKSTKSRSKYTEIIETCFTEIKIPFAGLSRQTLIKFAVENNNLNEKTVNKFFTKAIKDLIDSGKIVNHSGKGANGKFKPTDQFKIELKNKSKKIQQAQKVKEKKLLETEKQLVKDDKKKQTGEAKTSKKAKETKKETTAKPVTKAGVKKPKIDARKSLSVKISEKKLQMANKLIKEKKMEKPKKGEKLHVSILIPKPKKSQPKKAKASEPSGSIKGIENI